MHEEVQVGGEGQCCVGRPCPRPVMFLLETGPVGFAVGVGK